MNLKELVTHAEGHMRSTAGRVKLAHALVNPMKVRMAYVRDNEDKYPDTVLLLSRTVNLAKRALKEGSDDLSLVELKDLTKQARDLLFSIEPPSMGGDPIAAARCMTCIGSANCMFCICGRTIDLTDCQVCAGTGRCTSCSQ
jgi:hypothetical protein